MEIKGIYDLTNETGKCKHPSHKFPTWFGNLTDLPVLSLIHVYIDVTSFQRKKNTLKIILNMLEYLINIMLKILNILKYSLVYTLSLGKKKSWGKGFSHAMVRCSHYNILRSLRISFVFKAKGTAD